MAIKRFTVRNGEGEIFLPDATIENGVLVLDDEIEQHARFIARIESGEATGYDAVDEPVDAPKKEK